MQQVMNQFPQTDGTGLLIFRRIKEALNNGISKQVTKLTARWFYKNEAVKILLPEELRKVDAGLRSIGLSSLADEGLKVLNRAEDAVKEATLYLWMR
jgi:hypothetical protein